MNTNGGTLKHKYISGAFLLLLSTFVVKIIGAVYKIPLTSYIGAEGRGYFSVAYNLYMPIHALTMGAFPVALSTLVSTYNAKGNYTQIKALKKASGRLFFIIGLGGFAVMLLAAKPYSQYIASSPKSIYTIIALAPGVLFSCLAAGKRAFAEGFMDMKATALSQVSEALFKLVFGLLFAKLSLVYLPNLIKSGVTALGFEADFGEALSAVYPFPSAAAMLGVSISSLIGFVAAAVYIANRYCLYPCGRGDVSSALNELVSFSLPLVGATVIQSLANFADASSLQLALGRCDAHTLEAMYSYSGDDIFSYVYGIYSAALDFKSLVPAAVMALGVTAVPAVSAAYEGSDGRFSTLMTSIFKYTVIISSAGGAVLALFSKELLSIFYGGSNNDIVSSAQSMLFYFGVTMLPGCLASTAVFCVQSLGFSKNIIAPFIVSGVVRAAVNYFLVGKTEINIIGCAFSNFLGFLIICVWCVIIICKKTNYRFKIGEIIIRPVICTAITYFAVKGVKNGIFSGELGNVEFVLNIGLTAIILSLLLIIFKSISPSELKSLK